MLLSIIIVNWNSKDYVRKCLNSVQRTSEGLVYEIIVVDGGSFDGCDKMIKDEFPGVRFIQAQENLGFARANNHGFLHSKGDLLLLLNPDCELMPGAIDCLLSNVNFLPEVGILGPRLLNSDFTLQTTCVRSLPTILNRAIDCEQLRRLLPVSSLWGATQCFKAKQPVQVEAVSGACMLLRSDVFKAVGGFSPEFFMYGEDMDLCAKVRRLGLTNYHVPNATVLHHGSGSSKAQVSFFSAVMIRIAGETYMHLNHGYAAAKLYRLVQGLSSLVRICLLAVLVPFIDKRRRPQTRASLQKWVHIFLWAVGRSRFRIPEQHLRTLGDHSF